MRVNAIIEEYGGPNGAHLREEVEIPAGHWAVRMQLREHHPTMFGIDHETDKLTFIGQQPQRADLKLHTWTEEDGTEPFWDCYTGRYEDMPAFAETTDTTTMFWSDKPFAVVVDSDLGGVDCVLATLVNDQGLTRKLPNLPRLNGVRSYASWFGPAKRATKWVRMSDLCQAVQLDAVQILGLHAPLHFGNRGSVYILDTIDPAQEECTGQISGYHQSFERSADLIASIKHELWVTNKFALEVMYLNRLGWHAEKLRTVAS